MKKQNNDIMFIHQGLYLSKPFDYDMKVYTFLTPIHAIMYKTKGRYLLFMTRKKSLKEGMVVS